MYNLRIKEIVNVYVFFHVHVFAVFQKLLESQLEIQTRNAEELQSALERLRRESVNERRQRAMAAFSVAENIAVEREGLTRSFYFFALFSL